MSLAVFFATALVARAATVYFFNGTLPAPYTTSTAPDRHSLTQVSARKLNYNGGICINAFNLDSNGIPTGNAGQPDCTYVYNGLASHPYCGCQLRRAYVQNDSTTYSQEARAQYVY